MFSFLTGLIPRRKATQQIKLLDEGGAKSFLQDDESCIFCNVSAGNGFDVVWEDESFVAFKDHKPAAQHHLLVIPKTHIAESVKRLRRSDAGLVRAMGTIGYKLLEDAGVPMRMRKMGFHIPPFNSVHHLHLHVQGLPYIPWIRRAKYPVVKGAGSHRKGFSWFVEVGQAIRILENGSRIGVLPC